MLHVRAHGTIGRLGRSGHCRDDGHIQIFSRLTLRRNGSVWRWFRKALWGPRGLRDPGLASFRGAR